LNKIQEEIKTKLFCSETIHVVFKVWPLYPVNLLL